MKRYLTCALLIAGLNLILRAQLTFGLEKRVNSDHAGVTFIDLHACDSISSTCSDNTILLKPIGSNPNSVDQRVSISDSALWLNYSIVSGPSQPSRNICVKLHHSTQLKHQTLALNTSIGLKSGDGNLGLTSRCILLSHKDQELIKNIGSCFTENGPNKGHDINFILYEKPQPNDQNDENKDKIITVIFTISNN